MAASSSRDRSCPAVENMDLSELRPPIKMPISGIEQVMDVLLYGSLEVKQYLAAECDLIFECRVCRSLFRSLPNFVGHKRVFCQERMTLELIINDSSTECSDSNDNKPAESKEEVDESAPVTDIFQPQESQPSGGSTDPPAGTSQQSQKDEPSSSKANNKPTSKPVIKPNNNFKSKSKPAPPMPKTPVDPSSAAGKLTYADVVDFVKKTCKLCGMRSEERRHLVEHARNFHADRLYFLQCPHCPSSFFITGNLTRHLKNAHHVEAKAADVTLVLPGMSTHAMSVLTNSQRKEASASSENGSERRASVPASSSKKNMNKSYDSLSIPNHSSATSSDTNSNSSGSRKTAGQKKTATDSAEPVKSISQVPSADVKSGQKGAKDAVVKGKAASSNANDESLPLGTAAANLKSEVEPIQTVAEDLSTPAKQASTMLNKQPPAASSGAKSSPRNQPLRTTRTRSHTAAALSNEVDSPDDAELLSPPQSKVARITDASGPQMSVESKGGENASNNTGGASTRSTRATTASSDGTTETSGRVTRRLSLAASSNAVFPEPTVVKEEFQASVDEASVPTRKMKKVVAETTAAAEGLRKACTTSSSSQN